VTDNGNIIVDVAGLRIAQPAELEARLNQVPGVVCNGLFANPGASVALVAHADGVRTVRRA
jgi:ribose 5-phosphate isomerase A